MDTHNPGFLSYRRWASIFAGLLLLVFGSLYFFDVSAQTENAEKPAEQNLTLGRLAFSSRIAGPTVPEARIFTANPDGSGRTMLPVSSPEFVFSSEPAWSPDGTKLAFSWTQPPSDLYVINLDGSGQTNLTNTPDILEKNPSWSVTGKIAYERIPNGQIWVVNPDGSGNAQFLGITQPSPTSPAWSPDGAKLAFASGGEIWVINADGTNEQRITTSASADTGPAWSSDGSKIVFAKGGSIAVINADGTNETPLTISNGDGNPSWSPDGTKIAFRRSSSGASGIYTMDANGTNQLRIVADTIFFPQCCDTHYDNPTWQPVAQTPNTFNITGRVTNENLPVSGVTMNLSGTTNAAVTTDAVGNYHFSGLSAGGNYTVSPSLPRYYFTPPNRTFNDLASNQSGNFEVLGICQFGKCVRNGKIAFTRASEICTINADGSNLTNITNNAATDFGPNFSPDGLSIVFTTFRDGNSEIYRMNANGSNPVRLTNNTAGDSQPYYSPDGASIVFVSNRDGISEIYKMDADGTNQVRLTNNTSSETQPAFSPDGQKIVFVLSPAPSPGPMVLMTMNADGSNQQPFPNSSGFNSRPSYSPDGSKIIFVYGSDVTLQNIWTANADGTNRVQAPFGRSSPSYSPDGTKVVHACCFFQGGPSPNGIKISNFGGASGYLTTTNQDDQPAWQPIRVTPPAQFDFDGDGRSDVSVFRPSDGVWHLLRSQAGYSSQQWGVSTDVLTPADYDGDMKTDVAVWRPSEGNFYILNSFNSTVRVENFGLSGDVPTGGDWDGDGKADPAVYRAGAQGTFYYRGSMGNPQGNISNIPWGIPGDKPVASDYDGDGLTDAAIFRPSNGTWYIRQSSNGQLSAANFGLAGDALVPADYDADGKTDLAVYRGGTWYVLRSTQGFTAFQFGVSTDIPSPADYDGDGRADAAIFRNGVWWVMNSQSGTVDAIAFGVGSDTPVPSAFVR